MKKGLEKIALWSFIVCGIAAATGVISYKGFGLVAVAPGTFTLTECAATVAIVALMVGGYCSVHASETSDEAPQQSQEPADRV